MSATQDGSFTGVGGLKIVWRTSLPSGSPRAVIVLAHGFGEHSGRYEHVAQRLIGEGYAVYAVDHRSHGRSEGPRARINLADAVEDLDQLIVEAATRHPDLPVFLLGHSMGGAIALRYSMAHQDRLSGLILSAPLAEADALPASMFPVVKLLARLVPGLGLIGIDSKLVSRDPAVVKAYENDPLVHHGKIPATTIGSFIRHIQSLPGDVGRITVPTLLMYGTADKLALPSGAEMVSQKIGSSDLTTVPYDGLYHEILNEPEQGKVLDELCAWLAARVPALTT